MGRGAWSGRLAWAGRIVGMLAGLVLLAAAGGIVLLSQTVAGRQMAADFVEGALGDAVNGQVEFGPITGGNLFTHASFSTLAIRGPAGEPFVRLEDVRAEYDPLGLLRGRYVFRNVRIGRGELVLHQQATGEWNFDRIFGEGGAGGDPADTATVTTDGPGGAADEDAGGPRIELFDAVLEDGRVMVRTPYGPEPPEPETIWRVERDSAAGWEQVMRVDSLRGRLPRLLLADPSEPLQFGLRGMAGVARVVSQPLALRDTDAHLLFGDTVRVRLDRLSAPETELSGEGWIAGSDPTAYRFDLTAEPLGFGDLRWLPLPVPSRGGGPAELTLRNVGEHLAVDIRDGDVRSGENRVRGDLSVVLSETPRFDTLDVELEPLRLAFLEEIGAGAPARDGLLRGRVRGRGPADDFSMDARLTLDPLPPERAADAARSGVSARGGVSLVEPYRMRGLELGLDRFRPGWLRLLGLDLPLEGRLDGSVTLDGRPDSLLSFRADLSHRAAGDSASRVSGRGSVRPGDVPWMDVSLELRPLALDLLRPYVPELEPVGVVRGTVSAKGSLDDLRARADLTSPRGEIEFDGRFDLIAERRSYDATLTARDIQLRQWFEGGPFTRLAVRGSVSGQGTDPGDLEASFDLEILPSVVEGARVDSSILRFRLSGGLATVDTFAIRSDVGTLGGRGAVGLEEGRSGSLVLFVDAPELSSWNRWLVPGRNPVRPDTTLADLFEGLEAGAGEGQETPPVAAEATTAEPDTLAGSLTGRAVVYGHVGALSVGGQVSVRRPVYGDLQADSVVVTLDAVDPARLDTVTVRTVGWGVRTPVTSADSLYARVDRTGATSQVRLFVRRDTATELETAGNLRLASDSRAAFLESLRVRLDAREFRLLGPASVVYADSGLYVRDFRVEDGQGGFVRASGRIPDRGEADFELVFGGLPLEPLTALVMEPDTVGGVLAGDLRVRGTASEPIMEGSVEITGPRYQRLQQGRLRAEGRYENGTMSLSASLGTSGDRSLLDVSGVVRGDLSFRDVDDRFPEEPLDLTARADSLPAQLLELATGSFRNVEGRVNGEMRFRGAPGSMTVDGGARLEGGAATVPGLGVRFRNTFGAVRVRESVATVDSLVLRSSAGGSGRVSGQVNLANLPDPTLDLDLRMRRLGAMDRRRATVVLDGTGRLSGSYRAPRVTGQFRALNGDIRMEQVLREQQVVELTGADAFALLDSAAVSERRILQRLQNPFLQNMEMTVQLQVGPDLWLRSRDLEVEVAGDLRVRMMPGEESIALFGTLRLLRGRFRYGLGPYARELRIQEGTIEFVGTPGLNPNMDVTAVYVTRAALGRLTIRAHVSGTLLDKRLTLSSDPPLTESDQICYLLVGAGCLAAVGPQGEGGGGRLAERLPQQLLGTLGTQLSSLLVEDAWLDYLNVSTGNTLGVTDGTSGFASSGTFLSGTELEAGKYLGQGFFVSVNQTLGSRLPGATLEWTFARDWTLEARTENRFGRFGTITLGSTLEIDRLWGVFLFRDWTW